jgi:hypothetical protein
MLIGGTLSAAGRGPYRTEVLFVWVKATVCVGEGDTKTDWQMRYFSILRHQELLVMSMFMFMFMLMLMLSLPAGSLLKYYTSERDVGRRYRGLLSLEVSIPISFS